MKTTYRNVKISAPCSLYCWENSDYTIRIIRRSASSALVQGILQTREKIHTDEHGNEYIQFRSPFGQTQTYYAFATD